MRLDWAMAPMNFGNAFIARGERESGREEFEEMVAADRDTRKKLRKPRLNGTTSRRKILIGPTHC